MKNELYKRNQDYISIKPFILRSVLDWSKENNFSPLLITKEDYISYNLNDNFCKNMLIKSKEIAFDTLINHKEVHKILLVSSWHGVYIRELGKFFDLSFIENDNQHQKNDLWPNGIYFYIPPSLDNDLFDEPSIFDKAVNELSKTTLIQKRGKQHKLKLVWNNTNLKNQ